EPFLHVVAEGLRRDRLRRRRCCGLVRLGWAIFGLEARQGKEPDDRPDHKNELTASNSTHGSTSSGVSDRNPIADVRGTIAGRSGETRPYTRRVSRPFRWRYFGRLCRVPLRTGVQVLRAAEKLPPRSVAE